MWFGWSVSLWETIFFWVTASAAVFGSIGLAAAFFSAIIGYKISDEITRESTLAIAAANKSAADASTLASEARERAAQAELALEKFKAPRTLTPDSQATLSASLAPFKGTRFDMSLAVGNHEAALLGLQIAAALENAGWVWVEWNHPTGPFMNVYVFPGKPNIGQAGVGLGVQIQLFPDQLAEFSEAQSELVKALNFSGIVAAATPALDGTPNHDTLHIMVGSKP